MTDRGWLRALGEDCLAALLERRPEATAPPVPVSLSELADGVPDRAVGQVVRANGLRGEASGVEQCLGGLAGVSTLTLGAGHVDKQPGPAFG